MMGVQKTHEQFISEMSVIHPTICVLGEYKKAIGNVKVRCLLDGYEWSARPANLLTGYGCPKCAGNTKKTHEQFVEELNAVNPNIQVLGRYKTAFTKIDVRCKLDGHEWSGTPDNFLRGRNCPKCRLRNVTKTHEKFMAEMAIKHPSLAVLGEYAGSRRKILVLCLEDGHEWFVRPNSLVSGSGCPKCGERKNLKTNETFLSEMSQINKSIQILSPYVRSDQPLKVRCDVDGYEWSSTPGSLLSGIGCPRCARYGYDPSKPAELYVYHFQNYLGFGITNVPKVRHRKHNTTFRKLGIVGILTKTVNSDGKSIQSLESHLKRNLPIVNTGIEGFKTEAILYEDRELLFKAIEEFHYQHNSPLQDS